MECLPFAAGLQIIFCDDYANGVRRVWSRNHRNVDFDALANIDKALSQANAEIHFQ
jgi:hypothetical protein